MSGTSTDGIDVAVVDIYDGQLMELRRFETSPYPDDVRNHLLALARGEGGSAQVARWHYNLGLLFGKAARIVVDDETDVIGCHGHTIAHVIGNGGKTRATLQIGSPAVIAEVTGVTVTSDFRAGDVAAGGQGAPLVSLADSFQFRPEGKPGCRRALVNIGGIANVTVLTRDHAPIAFDTGPGNSMIDALTEMATGERFDNDGALAAHGQVDEVLLSQALSHPYFSRSWPKSTGREEFGQHVARIWWDEGRKRGLRPPDLVATATALTARTIAAALHELAVDEVFLAGGGSRNRTLVTAIRSALPSIPVRSHDDLGLPGDAKEAAVFGLLAARCILGLPSSLPSCTGASHPAQLGSITPGRNYAVLMTGLWR